MSNPDNSKLDRFKLETSFANGGVTHTTYTTDIAAGQRRVPVQTTWSDKKTLGSGGFGVVILQEAAGGHLRAVKKIYTGTGKMDFSREVSVMAKVAHRDDLFVKFLGWYANTDFVFIAMEYIEYGDLTHYLKNSGPCSAKNAQAITRQLLEGLATLHELNISHRDIKPQNVLIAFPDPIWVKIADFGLSKRAKGTMLHTRLGSHGYVAPELIGLLPRRYMTYNYSNAVDMWALGCLVHELLTGQIPFREIEYEADGTTEFDHGSGELIVPQTDMFAVKSFCHGKSEFPTDILRQSLVSETAIEFLKTILVANPESRAAAKGALGSAWLVPEEVPERDKCLGNLSFNAGRQNSGMATGPVDSVIDQGLPRLPVGVESSSRSRR
ncbi:hypothetical protein Q9L58_008515 [Maublancomyces gigas]|uniref:mitogen-activated protein kinase n=1 Tax=Discina gigas TaxID=1032678 RepID=A0ABR3G9G9_9PEZI